MLSFYLAFKFCFMQKKRKEIDENYAKFQRSDKFHRKSKAEIQMMGMRDIRDTFPTRRNY